METENLGLSTSYVLVDNNTGRYLIGRGWTTQKKYAKIYNEEAANQKIAEAYASSGVLLTKEQPSTEG